MLTSRNLVIPTRNDPVFVTTLALLPARARNRCHLQRFSFKFLLQGVGSWARHSLKPGDKPSKVDASSLSLNSLTNVSYADAKHRPPGAAGSDVAGIDNATSGSLTDRLTREHRMTLDEAHLILNVKHSEGIEHVIKNYEHLFKANSAPALEKSTSGRNLATFSRSHYLQSKVVRAKERIEAEMSTAESPQIGRPDTNHPPS
ncbi:hypothetical protein AX17_005825 [Amanita inopinata Kibby_2008]|nr:hypothetical protein AX17_005825 [Amanita inopinata Kibby_2008]